MKLKTKKVASISKRTASACHLPTHAALWTRLLVTESWKGAIGGESCHKSSAFASAELIQPMCTSSL